MRNGRQTRLSREILRNIATSTRPCLESAFKATSQLFAQVERWARTRPERNNRQVRLQGRLEPTRDVDVSDALQGTLYEFDDLREHLDALVRLMGQSYVLDFIPEFLRQLGYPYQADHRGSYQKLRGHSQSLRDARSISGRDSKARRLTGDELQEDIKNLAQCVNEAKSSWKESHVDTCRILVRRIERALASLATSEANGSLPNAQHSTPGRELPHSMNVTRQKMQIATVLAGMLDGLRLELESCRRQLDRAQRALRGCLVPETKVSALVRWVESYNDQQDQILEFHSAPLNPGTTLARELFGRLSTGVLTSATLAVNKDFGYLRSELGLNRYRAAVRESIFDSPFNYERQSCLIVPLDLQSDDRGVATPLGTAKAICEIVQITKGGLLALFTRYDILLKVAQLLKEAQVRLQGPLLVQRKGGDTRHSLLQDFKKSGNAVLLGTRSFWEGVDIPGPALRALVIHKLPFPVYTHPVWRARSDALKSRGGDEFKDRALPQASLHLKQGVGRLIRTKRDRGAVFLLDQRYNDPNYGNFIRSSLPEMPHFYGDLADIRHRIAEFCK